MTSPNFGRHDTNYHRFTQIITVPEGKAIKLHFTDFDTNLRDEYVKISNGDDRFFLAPILSGNSLPNDIVSPNNIVHVTFHSESRQPGSGWRLEWSEVQVPGDPQVTCQGHFDIRLPTGCYKIFHRLDNFFGGRPGMTWPQAMALCGSGAGWKSLERSWKMLGSWKLAEIESEEENVALAGVLGSLYGRGMARKYWIGLADFGEGLNWTWHTQAQEFNETIQNRPWNGWFNQLTSSTESYRRKVPLLSENVTYEAWAPNQPDTNGDDDDDDSDSGEDDNDDDEDDDEDGGYDDDDDDDSDGDEDENPQVVLQQVELPDDYSDENDDGDDGDDGGDGDKGEDIDDVDNGDSNGGNENCAYISIGKPDDDSFGKWHALPCDKSWDGMAWHGKVGIGAICKAMP